MIDPFDSIPAARPEECDVRKRFTPRPEKPCELVAKPKKKRVDLSGVQRRWFEREGYTYARVDHANAWGAMTVDLWGCFDWLAVRADLPGVLLVQTTSLANLAARRKKIRAAPETAVLLAAGNRLQIHGWDQPDGPGGKWWVKVVEVQF